MGRIISSKTVKDNKVVFEIELDYEESLVLKGHIRNVHIFSEDAAEIETNLSQRGANEATKYFLIPRKLRDNINFDNKVKCQKIDTTAKAVFVFVTDKVEIL